jgi:hypothetical protein
VHENTHCLANNAWLIFVSIFRVSMDWNQSVFYIHAKHNALRH